MSDDKPIYDEVDDHTEAPDHGREGYKDEKAIRTTRRRGSRSTFAPIVLIAGGVLFLLANVGVIDALDWRMALRFWPLALIFLGLNVLAVQARPPVGTALSTLVALSAVGVFGWLLLSGPPAGVMRSLGLSEAPEPRLETFDVPAGNASSAEVTLDITNYDTIIGPDAGSALVAGTIWTRAGLNLESELDDGRLTVEVGERRGQAMFNPDMWFTDADHVWQVQLSPHVPIDLEVDAGNGNVTADMSALTLTALEIDAGNGRISTILPGGDYDATLDAGNGGINVALPSSGELEVRIDGGNGRIDLSLPVGMEARVEYDIGNGSVNVPDHLRLVRGDKDEGVYETDGYERSADRVLLIVSSGNGSVTITSP